MHGWKKKGGENDEQSVEETPAELRGRSMHHVVQHRKRKKTQAEKEVKNGYDEKEKDEVPKTISVSSTSRALDRVLRQTVE